TLPGAARRTDRPPRSRRAPGARRSWGTPRRTPSPSPACTRAPGCSTGASARPSAPLDQSDLAALEIHVGLDQELDRVRLSPELARDLERQNVVVPHRILGRDPAHRQRLRENSRLEAQDGVL